MPSSSRFIVLSNMNGQAVLDRETGLVWERTPGTVYRPQAAAFAHCWETTTGGRQGWRIPTVAEFLSLADASNSRGFEIRLAQGHPFNVPRGERYWASDRLDMVQLNTTFFNNVELGIYFGDLSDPNAGGRAGGQVIVGSPNVVNGNASATWCVRGGHGGSAR